MDFDEFAASQAPAMLRFARALSGERDLAEDLVQDVFIKLHRAWPNRDSIGNLDAYVRRMIVNEYLTWRRKWSRIFPVAKMPKAPAAADVAASYAEQAMIRAELSKLPPRQRAVIVLRYYAGLTDTEIAAELGCNPATVRSHASRALARLRIDMAEVSSPPKESSR